MSQPTPLKPLNSSLILLLIAVALVCLGVAQGINEQGKPLTPVGHRVLPSVLPPTASSSPLLRLNGQPFSFELAATPQTRSQGLSGRLALGPREALLFVFPETESRPGFWMKEMNFAIDIIWLDARGQIVDLTKNFTPESYPKIIYPQNPIRLVLEVASGTIDALNLRIGDIVPIPVSEKGL